MKTKKCYNCKETKSVSEYGEHAGRPDGLRAECKVCTRELSRQWRENNKKHTAEFRRKHFIQSGRTQRTRRDIKGVIKRDYPENGFCEICEVNNKKLAYHHFDDDFPSWGFWLCAGCHVGASFLERTEFTEKYWELRAHIKSTHTPDVSNAPKTLREFKKYKKRNELA